MQTRTTGKPHCRQFSKGSAKTCQAHSPCMEACSPAQFCSREAICQVCLFVYIPQPLMPRGANLWGARTLSLLGGQTWGPLVCFPSPGRRLFIMIVLWWHIFFDDIFDQFRILLEEDGVQPKLISLETILMAGAIGAYVLVLHQVTKIICHFNDNCMYILLPMHSVFSSTPKGN